MGNNGVGMDTGQVRDSGMWSGDIMIGNAIGMVNHRERGFLVLNRPALREVSIAVTTITPQVKHSGNQTARVETCLGLETGRRASACNASEIRGLLCQGDHPKTIGTARSNTRHRRTD
ncbi:hypothetical protein WR25_17835 [Diploscapter pachys]|uniref:Uncharacterized protein n=1 Tax=Diploscapter pachys TaxID=2018661 RepID=A0A2A2KYR2_9BILA|nr:hypothetical protein WR25_17835 [Diploscapter pachys]